MPISQVALGSDKDKFSFQGPAAPPMMEVMRTPAALKSLSKFLGDSRKVPRRRQPGDGSKPASEADLPKRLDSFANLALDCLQEKGQEVQGREGGSGGCVM